MTEEQEEVVKCLQCNHPVLRGEPYIAVAGLCPDCGEIEVKGVVHEHLCAVAIALEQPRADTQKARVMSLRMN